MEVFATKDEYLVVCGENALHCCRKFGKLTPKQSSILCELRDPRCLGIVFGVLGRLSLNSNKENFLLLIKQWKHVGVHPLNKKFLFKIQEVVALPLNNNAIVVGANSENSSPNFTEVVLNACKKHLANSSIEENNAKKRTNVDFTFLQKHQKKVLKATTDSLKFVSEQVTLSATKQQQNPSDQKAKIMNTAKLLEEILKLFNENSSFYYSECDLTNSVDKIIDGAFIDERYFWNRSLLSDIETFIASNERQAADLGKFWLKPIIQGYIEIRTLELDTSLACDLTLISRRSVRRAGTRYIKRGVDESGNCANFVETEQILTISGHILSFMQIRASIPLFWSQPGYKYKPPPRIDRSKAENSSAFQRHFQDLASTYKDSAICVVNLVDQTGKERVLSDAYMEYTLEYDSDNLIYVAFDFHEYCRGLKFENVSLLVDACNDLFQITKFSWVDKKREFISRQSAVFRVNCVDCLDRTNVVQSAFAKYMLECQLRKLGLMSPDDQLSKHCHNALQSIWANNGDAVSRQYAGTAALKGDFTRTGQRNFAGMVRDGYNSANRYYLCHMKDARRQAAIDLLLGQNVSTTDIENDVRRSLEGDESWFTEKDEHLRLLVLDCEKLIIPQDEVLLAGWAMIDADAVTGDESEDEMDTVVMLTRDAYYVAAYDEALDKFVDVQRILLQNIEFLEAGPMTVSTLFGVSRSKSVCLRVNYKTPQGESGYFHVWRAGGTRLFNNLAISIKSPEEANEYVYAIAEQFNVALQVAGFIVPVKFQSKLERKKSKLPLNKSMERKNASGFVSYLLSPLTSAGAKTVGSILKSSSSATGKLFAQNSAASDGSALLQTNRAVSKTTASPATCVPQALPLFKTTSFDIIDNNCGVLFTSVSPPSKDSINNERLVAAGRRFSQISTALPNGSISPLPSRRIPVLNLPISDDAQVLPVSTVSVNLELLPQASNENQNQQLKLSRSESSLKKLDVASSGVKRVEKSSSSAMLEKLVDGRKFMQNFGYHVFVGGKKQMSAPAHHWREYEQRIKSSRTKFVLL